MRRTLLEGTEQKDRILEICEGIVGSFIDMRIPEKAHPSEWDLDALASDVLTQFGVKINTSEFAGQNRVEVENIVNERVRKKYEEKESLVGPELMRETERMLMLNVIDNQWKDHLLSMDHLKEGIGLRGYGQKDPLIEYKKESYVLFQDMMDRIEDETIRYLFFLQPVEGDRVPLPYPDVDDDDEDGSQEAVAVATHDQKLAAQSTLQDFTRSIQRKKERELAELQFVGGEAGPAKQPVIKSKKPGRNDPCSCGSGKKYKKCCGA